jgi:hypothetical protein
MYAVRTSLKVGRMMQGTPLGVIAGSNKNTCTYSNEWSRKKISAQTKRDHQTTHVEFSTPHSNHQQHDPLHTRTHHEYTLHAEANLRSIVHPISRLILHCTTCTTYHIRNTPLSWHLQQKATHNNVTAYAVAPLSSQQAHATTGAEVQTVEPFGDLLVPQQLNVHLAAPWQQQYEEAASSSDTSGQPLQATKTANQNAATLHA